MKDLVALVADGSQKMVLETLLSERRLTLGIREVSSDIEAYPKKDSGVYRSAGEFLRGKSEQFRYALVVVDAAWDGSPGADAIRKKITNDMELSGWDEIRVVGRETQTWVTAKKPEKPKELLEAIRRRRRIPKSQSLFVDLAKRVSLERCADPAFHLLRQRLSEWFPPEVQ